VLNVLSPISADPSMADFGIVHESGELRRVLVHHPGRELELANSDPVSHHFDMPVDVKHFQRDHGMLMKALEEAGVEVLNVSAIVKDDPKVAKQVGQCPNLVFARDSSFVTDAGAVLMRMGLPSRRKETPVIRAAHEAIGVPVAYQIGEPDTFEGGGFALLEGRVAVAGLCQRTTRGALEGLGSFLLDEGLADLYIVLNMPPTDIHIDGDFAELPGKTAITYSPSLDFAEAEFRTRDDSWKGSYVEWLRNDGWDIIEITEREMLDMAANFLTVAGDLTIHYTGNERVMKEVRKRGIEVIQIPGDEMRKGCGGIHCMTCPVLRV